MTTESKKPSAVIAGRAAALRSGEALANWGAGQPNVSDVLWWLDGEAERLAKFEADVLARLAKLEAAAPPPVDPAAPYGQCDRCGEPLGRVSRNVGGKHWCAQGCKPKQQLTTEPLTPEDMARGVSTARRPQYVGDGLPAVKYDRDPEGSEEL